ncbi:hypothetical protein METBISCDRAFT_22460 [Metschnikowia bicuspidata]|uniref:Uncharacterized protein n=1 Tax=Metschnikowia bicuspidata TaxID=27322 RepID=A0A4P9ZEL0_9ASCO|nr:hypothetical protein METBISCDRAFT_22460 [Metschnikowia bicuspidata]
MSEFKAFKKADLAKIMRKLGISVRAKDTKLSLLEKLKTLSDENPKAYRELVVSLDDDEGETATLVEIEGTEDETEEVDDDAEVDDDDEHEETDEDKDYKAPPPIDIKEYLVDPAIALFEKSYDKLLEFTDYVGLTSAQYNDKMRVHLSNTFNLMRLELLAEAAYFLYFHVPVVKARNNKCFPQFVKNSFPFLDSELPTFDFSSLLNCTVTSVFVQWLLYAVLVPTVISYYVNFTRKVVVIESDADDEDKEELSYVVRFHRHDPVIFSLAKTVLFYFIVKNGAFAGLDTTEGVACAVKQFLLVKLGIYRDFALRLGNFPVVIGATNVIIGLYSQFEDF